MPLYAAARALLCAFHTADAFRIIDLGQAVLHGDRADRARLCAQAAGDASVFAQFHDVFALSVIGTGDIHFGIFRDAADDAFRTIGNACPAGNALFFVHDRIAAVAHVDGIIRTDIGTGLFSDTADRTRLDAARDQFARGAVAVALIIVFVVAGVSAAAMHDGDRVFPDLSAAQNLRNFFFVGRGRGAAVGKFCLSLYERFRKLRAARLAAAAAVGLCEKIFHLFDALVLFDGKNIGTDDEDDTENQRYGEHDAARNGDLNDRIHSLLHPASMPEKPANAIAMIAAVISVIGKPLKHFGISALSVFRRTHARRTMANKNPTPVATDMANV